MKLSFIWNGVLFISDKYPQFTELFSEEQAKEHDFTFSKIRRGVCIVICNEKREYINPQTFGSDED